VVREKRSSGAAFYRVEEEGEEAAKAVEASSGDGAPSKLMELGGEAFREGSERWSECAGAH
jgi:hypothetical protein